jgi:maltose/moltooligosaccharide transporter
MSLLLSGLGFIYMFFTPSTLMYLYIDWFFGKYLSMPYAMLSSAVNPKKWE